MEFLINTQSIPSICSSMDVFSKSLEAYSTSVSTIKDNCAIHGAGSESIKRTMMSIAGEISQEKDIMNVLSGKLEAINSAYISAESKLIGVGAVAVKPTITENPQVSKSFDIGSELFKWSNLWKLIGNGGIIGAAISVIGSGVTGSGSVKDYLSIAKYLTKAVGGTAKAIGGGASTNWWESLTGLSDGLKGLTTTNAGTTFKSSVVKQLTTDLGIGKAPKNVGEGIGVATKWLGHALTFATNGVENYDEFGGITARGAAETVVESGVDIGLGIAATAGVSAAATTIGVVTAPAVVIGGIATVTVIGANAVCKWATGGKDIGEVVADTVIDGGQKIVEGAGKAVKSAGKAVSKAGKKLSTVWSSVTSGGWGWKSGAAW